MQDYRHRVVGLYPSRALAEEAREEMLAQGLTPERIRVLDPASHEVSGDFESDNDDVLKDIFRDGAIGTAVGTAVGAGVSIAIAAANITLFIASPVLGTLTLLGWGGSLGGLVGAAVGADRSEGDVSGMIKDALANGHFVLVAHAVNEAQTTEAQRIATKSILGSASTLGTGSAGPDA